MEIALQITIDGEPLYLTVLVCRMHARGKNDIVTRKLVLDLNNL